LAAADASTPRWLEAEEGPEGADVAAVVAGAVDGRFAEEGALGAAQAGMVEDAAEGFATDVAAANVLVSIDAGGERGLGVVDVEHANVFEAEGGLGFVEGALEALRRTNFEAGGEEMSGVETDAGLGDDVASAASIEHLLEMRELRTEASSLPCGVFDEDADGNGGRADTWVRPYGESGAGDGFRNVLDAARNAGVAGGAGMDDEVVCAELEGAEDFVTKGADGIFPLARVGRGQIDQIVGVDGDGAEAERGAAFAETFGNGSGNGALMRARPHARAAGKDLEGGAADAGGGVEGAAGFAGDGGVDADAGAAIEPGWGGNEGGGGLADRWRIDFGGLRIGHRAFGSILHVAKIFRDREIILAEGLQDAQSAAA
jgi:hypothetical protein